MLRRFITAAALAALLIAPVACTNKKVKNPIADVGSKQPDKVLFDRAMDAMKHNKFDVARLSLQTLINTYPDSEFIARAKLAIGDSWYAEGGTAGYQQAEAEYKDFQTFFPNMPESAEAQLKIAEIHYKQMEKPDRDFTHAKRAEDEYRQLLLNYPDNQKLVPIARERLLEVQEVLAEREFRIGKFYFLREAWPACIARLKSVTDAYPLYSDADEALFMMGQAYEREIDQIRLTKLQETTKGKLIDEYTKGASAAYSKIVSRYPMMARVADAKARLEALKQPVPTPTPEMMAQNKAEIASRSETGKLGRFMMNFHKRPDVAQAAKVGEPTLVDSKQTNATDLVREAVSVATGGKTAGSSTATVERVDPNAPVPENQPIPRSDNQAQPAAAGTPTTDGNASSGNAAQQDSTAIPELKSDLPASGTSTEQTADPPTTTPATGQEANPQTPPAAPQQVNDVGTGSSSSSSQQSSSQAGTSSSKKKGKKGIRKAIPF